MTLTETPARNWQKLATDLKGPLPSGENILVVINYKTKYPVTAVLRKTTSEDIIYQLEKMFGYPETIVSDNGPQFTSNIIENYFKSRSINHIKSSPYWPQGYSEVERMNRTISKIIKCAYTEGNDWKTELDQFLLMYRTTPHATTGISPAAALFRHQLNNGIPAIQQSDRNQPLNKAMEDKRLRSKSYIDTKRDAKFSDNLSIGQQVLAKNFHKTSKMDSFYEKQPYIIKSVQKHSCIISRNGQSFTRHKA